MLPLLSPFLLLQLVSFPPIIRVQGGDCVVFLGVNGQWGSWLWTFPAPVLRDLGRALGAGGWGSRGPAITVSCAACTVGGTGATAQWRVLLWIWDVTGIGQDESAKLVKILYCPPPPVWRTEALRLKDVGCRWVNVTHLHRGLDHLAFCR